MKQTVRKVLGVAGAATLCGLLGSWNAGAANQANNAGTRPQGQTAHRANTANNDEQLVRSAAESSMSQVDLGKLTEQKAQDPQVKKFAQLMTEEHSKLTEQLKELGMSERINLPTSVSRRDADSHRHLQTESGAGFDKSYTQQVVTELERQIGQFKQGSTSATKPALKEFFERNTPTLESELQQAKQLAAHAH